MTYLGGKVLYLWGLEYEDLRVICCNLGVEISWSGWLSQRVVGPGARIVGIDANMTWLVEDCNHFGIQHM